MELLHFRKNKTLELVEFIWSNLKIEMSLFLSVEGLWNQRA